MNKELVESESFLFKKNDNVSISFLEKLYYFIETYKFSLETVSILTKIDTEKLNNFYYKNGELHYDELSLINKVIIIPFENVFSISEYNCKKAMEIQEKLRELRKSKK